MSERPASSGTAKPTTRRTFIQSAAAVAGGLAVHQSVLARRVEAQTTKKTDLIIAQAGDISKLDPHLSTAGFDVTVTFNLYDHLVSRRRDNKLYPSLALSWTAVQPTVWQFKLRPGVKFHNGDLFTSADVKFSVERTYDPQAKTNVSTIFTTVDRVETPDALTVSFVTKKPDPLLPARLAFYGGQIIPKKYFEAVGADQFNAKPVGTGPVRFVSWRKDDQLVFDAVPDYWGGRVAFNRLVFRPIPETAVRVGALLKGEVDMISKLPPDSLDQVRNHPTTKVESILFAGQFVLAVNSKRPPLDNPVVKQALSLAIDRETIVKELWHGQAIVPNGPIAKGDNHYDEKLPPLKYDPALARQRLQAAGYKGEEIILESTSGVLSNDKAMSEAVIAMWRDVGVNAKVEIIEASVRAQKIRERSLKGLLWIEPASTLGDPDGMMWRLLAPGAVYEYWRQPRFEELGNAARFSLDENFRGKVYAEMTQIVLENFPWIPVLQANDSYGLQRYVDWKPYPNQQIELRAFNFKFRQA